MTRFELDYDDEDCACISNFTDNKEKLTDREVVDLLNFFHEENTELRRMIKAKVLQQYRDGSLADLQFKAIAYDDITKVEMDYEFEPTLKIYYKPNTRQNIQSFIQLFVPFGVYYETIEDGGDGV